MAPSHPELLWVLVASGVSCAFLAVSIGANDVANAFSTSIGSGTLSLRTAIVIAFVFELLGSIFLGGTVTDAIRTKILNFESFSDCPYELALGMLCASLGSSFWLAFATYFGIPVSTTHSLIGALAGFGIASGRFSGVNWLEVLYIVISWFVVPAVSIFVSGFFYILIQETVLKRKNSFWLMKYFHWVFLAIFSVPLSIFISFENSILRSANFPSAKRYQEWFNASNWNKLLSVALILATLLLVSSLVTYSVCRHRLRTNWSYIESLHSISPSPTKIPMSNKRNHTQSNSHSEVLGDKVNPNSHSEVQGELGDPDDKVDLVDDVEELDEIDEPLIIEEGSSFNHSTNGDLINTTTSLHSGVKHQSGPSKDGIVDDGIKLGSSDKECKILIEDKESAVSRPVESRTLFDRMLRSVGLRPRESQGHSTYVRPESLADTSSASAEQSQSPGLDRLVSSLKSTYNRSLKRLASRASPRHGANPNAVRPGKFRVPREIKESDQHRTQVVFSAMQIVGASIAVISQSSNDTANAISTFSTIFFLYHDGVNQSSKLTPWYILLSGGLFMGFGLAFFGYKVIKTVGLNITRVTPSRGYTIDSSSGGIILFLSQFGIPISSTHVSVSSILGVGMVQHLSSYEGHYKIIQSYQHSLHNPPNSHSVVLGQPSSNNTQPNLQGEVQGDDVEQDDKKPDESKMRLLPRIFKRLTTRHVNFKLYRKIFMTWIITIFTTGVITGLFFFVGKLIYKLRS